LKLRPHSSAPHLRTIYWNDYVEKGWEGNMYGLGPKGPEPVPYKAPKRPNGPTRPLSAGGQSMVSFSPTPTRASVSKRPLSACLPSRGNPRSGSPQKWASMRAGGADELTLFDDVDFGLLEAKAKAK